MIPRREAQRLLGEYAAAVRALALASPDDDLDWLLDGALRTVVAGSDLVSRGAENVQQKARRVLAEGRLRVDRADGRGGAVVATARGESGGEYRLGYDGREWRCTCPAKGRCSHLAALQLVVVREAQR